MSYQETIDQRIQEWTNLQPSCSKCGLKFTDSFGRPIAMGYYCSRNDCPTQARSVL